MTANLRKYDSRVRTQAAYMCNTEAYLAMLENLANQQGSECYTEYSRAYVHSRAGGTDLTAVPVENVHSWLYNRVNLARADALVHDAQFRTDAYPLNLNKIDWVKPLPKFENGFPSAVSLHTVGAIKDHLLDKGIPVIFGDSIDPVSNDNAYNVLRATNDRPHAILIVGYDDTNFIFKNTNGSMWGDEGYGYLSIESMKDSTTLDGFSLSSKPDFPELYWWRKNKFTAWLVKAIGFDIDFST